ncbi:Stp1/IreP family PP2C-type Ser/Thr phosphatase [Vagococcus elongatus]|uniref:protein-serine/threonine phosphatase n=1 Tax=Vagococcus elongatus TaxID=180344 RepID=A0A430AYF2_9ENTE|nr:Stp1/IreP family PP2C-type Ser/Thr phosphatase [Vagococcus elongatus]RSU13101.1 protein phosphatase [Vagococcus elongatus]
MKIEFQTDVGKRRTTNQDSVGIFYNQEQIRLAIVADGMGGHQAGDIASQLTVSDLGNIWRETSMTDQEEVIRWLLENIQRLNEKIFEEGQVNPRQTGMGTTIVAAVLLGTTVVLANVGDSRSYLIRQETIKQVTEDHSLVNELVKTGEITEEMALTHPRKNVLVRSLGIPGTVEIDVTSFELLEGDRLLLCTDGLSNMVSDDTILAIVSQADDIKQAVDTLIKQANEAGGRDNITVLLVDYERKAGEQAHG